jgi:hypothetical protein
VVDRRQRLDRRREGPSRAAIAGIAEHRFDRFRQRAKGLRVRSIEHPPPGASAALESDAGAQVVDAPGVAPLIVREDREGNDRYPVRKRAQHGSVPAVAYHGVGVRNDGLLSDPALDMDVWRQRPELARVRAVADRHEDPRAQAGQLLDGGSVDPREEAEQAGHRSEGDVDEGT